MNFAFAQGTDGGLDVGQFLRDTKGVRRCARLDEDDEQNEDIIWDRCTYSLRQAILRTVGYASCTMFVISSALTFPAPSDCRSEEQPEVTLETMSERVWFVHWGWEHMPESQLLMG